MSFYIIELCYLVYFRRVARKVMDSRV